MKRFLSIFLAVILLCSFTVITVPTKAATYDRTGDINNDGYITAADARLCLRYVVYLEDLDYESALAADIGSKGYVAAEDAREILRFSVGLPVDHIKYHPVENPINNEFSADDLPEGSKILYMTFDDGPSSYTEEILDILDEYDAKATFFVIYQPYYSEEYKMIVDRGQTIALHSYTHDYSEIYSSTTGYFNDLQKISDHVYNLTGVRTNLIRFPGGSSNTVSEYYSYGIMTTLADMVEDRGYVYFDWNASNDDATGEDLSAEEIYEAAIGYTQDEIVMLMHDTNAKAATVEALPWIIEYYQARGYYCMALTENSETAHHYINN